jgi:electron transport complex protein RnfB
MDSELIKLALGGIALLGCIGLLFGIGLAIAAQKFYVEPNPKVEAVLESLPGAQCGGCGYAGCEGYARAVVDNPDVPPTLCFPGKQEVAIKVAELTGKEMTVMEDTIATVRCSRKEGHVPDKFEYIGFASCTAAHLTFGGPQACQYACIGLGECAEACPFDAMTMEKDFPVIDPELCTSCGICVNTCPKDVLEIVPRNARIQIPCSTNDIGKVVKKVCDIGCVNCQVCIKKCPAHAISWDDGIHVDHKACLDYGPECNELCIDVCPRHTIIRTALPRVTEPKVTEPAEAA